ncbi:MAG TPA: SRPBCC family protein [Candidatus Limnocylindria bacterium]|nr:SRPBCC family protein [Candidatus Limnocylindria bacterium]
MRRGTKVVAVVAAAPFVLAGTWAVLFAAGLGGWMANWGATSFEASVRLPGDDVLPDAVTFGTKSITIQASPEEIWPWLAQMGVGRAGMYSYDWIDRMIGSGEAVDGESAMRIHPELQDRQVGDHMVLHPPSGLAYTVALVKPPRLIVYRGESLGPLTWTFYLLPNDDGTRLITRWRGTKARSFGETVANAVFGTMDFVMEQRMLTRIKALAEAHASEVGNLAIPLDVSK